MALHELVHVIFSEGVGLITLPAHIVVATKSSSLSTVHVQLKLEPLRSTTHALAADAASYLLLCTLHVLSQHLGNCIAPAAAFVPGILVCKKLQLASTARVRVELDAVLASRDSCTQPQQTTHSNRVRASMLLATE